MGNGANASTVGRGCVLVVEDDRMLAAALRQLLENEGHSVLSCTCVATARTALCKRQFDLVISDYQLEDGPADGLIAWMCTQGAAPPVLLMTATPELPSAVTQAPVVRRVIAKPAAPETLLGWVEQFIPRDLPRVVFPRLVGTAERSLLLEDSPAWNGIPG